MNESAVKKLSSLTQEFYLENHESFSDTRQSPWPGWEKCAEAFETMGIFLPTSNGIAKVIDVGCGNLRFERFLLNRFNCTRFEFRCLDSSEELRKDGLVLSQNYNRMKIEFERVDIVENIMTKNQAIESNCSPCADIVVAFGLFHHIPSSHYRMKLLENLINLARPGGIIAISLWCFAKDEKLIEKANAATSEAIELGKIAKEDLEENDFLLGWRDKKGFYRYCHSFKNDEIESIIEQVSSSAKAMLLRDFYADGRSGNLNRYLVFEVL